MTTHIKIEYKNPVQLVPNPWNSNRVGSEMEARLEASIREFGFVKPILVRQIELSGQPVLQILGGEHRVRKAREMGIAEVPVVILQGIDDKRAKALGLADNGRYGEDDALKLSAILGDLGDDLLGMLPFDEQDLAGIFASSSVNLDDLGFDDDRPEPDMPPVDAPRASITHELMRFKVPIEDREAIDKFFSHVIKSRGYSSEQDSMVAAGMALVDMVKACRDSL